LIRQVRALERTRNGRAIPAVALTAYARPQDRDKALAAGFQWHVGKPVDPEEFVSTIAMLARRFNVRQR